MHPLWNVLLFIINVPFQKTDNRIGTSNRGSPAYIYIYIYICLFLFVPGLESILIFKLPWMFLPDSGSLVEDDIYGSMELQNGGITQECTDDKLCWETESITASPAPPLPQKSNNTCPSCALSCLPSLAHACLPMSLWCSCWSHTPYAKVDLRIIKWYLMGPLCHYIGNKLGCAVLEFGFITQMSQKHRTKWLKSRKDQAP